MAWILWLIIIIFSFLTIVKLYVKLTTGWCRSQVCLVGKTVIVTGANTGIGYETAIDLAKRGARVILACRDSNKAKDAVEKIIKETDNPNVSYKILDLASLKSVRAFAEDINKTEPKLDILINNAGAFGQKGVSEDGLNLSMQSNYYGPFLLTNLLLDLLKKSGSSRIINVSSQAAKRETGKYPLDVDNLNDQLPEDRLQYGRTKLCNIMFTIELSKRLQGTKVTTYSLHPGVILTDFTRFLTGFGAAAVNTAMWLLAKNTIEGAQTTIYCAIEKGLEDLSGEHFADCHYLSRYKSANDEGLAKRLWEKTEQLVKLKK